MAAKGLRITSTDGGFKAQGINNVLYPDNAVLTYPANSVIMVLDESDIVTFRSAANNDVLFSGKINEITIDGASADKETIIEAFNEAANKPMGSGGGDITGLFADAAYDERQKKIEFYDIDGNEVASIDATDFIKDGMVSNVEISNGNLVITFNTDAGKEPISIALTDIFNPSNYYTKTQIDGFLSEAQTLIDAKADSADLATVATSGSYNDLTDKPTIPTVPTNVSAFTNDANYVDSNRLNTAINGLQQQIDTKEEVISTALNTLSTGKADKTEIEALEPYTIDLDALIADGVTSTQYDEIADAVDSGRVIKATYDGREYTVEAVYVNGDVMKLTVSDELKHRFFQLTKTTGTVSPTTAEYVSLVEKGTWNTKQPLLVSGTNIKTINNESILGEGNIEIQGGVEQVQSDWNQSDTTAVDYIKNKPTIPAAQVNSDWNASSGVAQILNKPDLSIYAQSSTLATVATSGDYDDLSNKPTIPDTSDFVSKSEYNPKELAIAEALTDLNENKADKTELPDVSTLATKTELNAKQDTLVSGTNIKTINNESILGSGNITIEASGGGMDEDTELLISSALVDLNDRKIDAYEVKENYQKKGDYATNTDLALKANSADVPTLTDYDEAQKITSWSLNELNARIAALEEAMGGMKIVKITQSAYDALTTKDANTLYVIYSETSTGGN